MKLSSSGGKFNIGHVFIALGLVSIVLTYLVISSMVNGGKRAEQTTKVEKFSTSPIIVASRFISTGEVVSDLDVKLVEWPVKYFPLGDVYTKQEDIIGHAAQNDIYPGQPVFKGSLSGEVSDGGLMWIIPKGMRAITIGVNELKGVAGFVKPGSRVDILATLNYSVTPAFSVTGSGTPQKEDVKVTTTVLQDVKVLAVAQQLLQNTQDSKGESKGDKKSDSSSASTPPPPSSGLQGPAASITLAVTPKQAEILALAENQGDLKLVLRHQEDIEQISLEGASDSDVVTDMSIFSKITNFISERTMGGLGGGMMNIPASQVPSTSSSGIANSPARSPMPVSRSSSGHHVTIIKGTEITDTYVQH